MASVHLLAELTALQPCFLAAAPVLYLFYLCRVSLMPFSAIFHLLNWGPSSLLSPPGGQNVGLLAFACPDLYVYLITFIIIIVIFFFSKDFTLSRLPLLLTQHSYEDNFSLKREQISYFLSVIVAQCVTCIKFWCSLASFVLIHLRWERAENCVCRMRVTAWWSLSALPRKDIFYDLCLCTFKNALYFIYIFMKMYLSSLRLCTECRLHPRRCRMAWDAIFKQRLPQINKAPKPAFKPLEGITPWSASVAIEELSAVSLECMFTKMGSCLAV